MSPSTAPSSSDDEAARKAKVLTPILDAMAVLCVFAFMLSLLDSGNELFVSVALYGAVFAVVAALRALTRRGHAVAAAWTLSVFVWLLIASVLPLFGGMNGHNASVFAVSIMLIGTLVGSRPALVLALLSSAWCAFVVALELTGTLPAAMSAYSPINAWIALSATLLLTTVLVLTTLRSLRDLHERAVAAANERDEALRRSIRAQKMELVGNLSSGIAHDFNNLLTVMKSAGQHLRARLSDSASDVVGALDDLDAVTQRATLMTRQLLTFGRAVDGPHEPIDVGQVVRSFASLLPRLLLSKIKIVVDAPEAATVSGSRAGLEQLLLNLAVNARDAMEGGGTLTFRVRTEGDAAVISVADTGAGIDPAIKSQIFEAFFTTKSTGTGLGLATVHDVVTRLGGSISVDSIVGEGTTFHVRLPLVA
jgi:signal transduction histidine kinase